MYNFTCSPFIASERGVSAAAAALSWLCAWLVCVSCLSLRSGLVFFFTDNAMTVDVGERRLVRL